MLKTVSPPTSVENLTISNELRFAGVAEQVANFGSVPYSYHYAYGTSVTDFEGNKIDQVLPTRSFDTFCKFGNIDGPGWRCGGAQSYLVFYAPGAGGEFYFTAGSAGVVLTNGATSWASLSDEREKEIVEPITDASAKLLGLRSVIGRYKNDAKNVRRSFLIAQDVEKVLPEAVKVHTAPDSKEARLVLNYTEVIPLLVAAINELQQEVQKLKGN
jgi:hypothetical protein